MSRQTVLTPELIAAIEKALADGMPMKHAVGALGLSHNTFRKQLERGNADLEEGAESIFADLARAVARGRAAKVSKWVGWLQEPDMNGLQNKPALMFLLERTEPKEFGPSSKVEIDATVTQRPPRQEMDDTLAKIAAALKGDALPR